MADALQATDTGTPAAQRYQERRDRYAASVQRLRGRDKLVSRMRMGLFSAGASCLGGGLLGVSPNLLYTLAGALGAVFLAVIIYHEWVRDQLAEQRELKQINEHMLARLARNWDRVRLQEVAVPDPHQATAADLDLFGSASLFHFLCLAQTPLGVQTLRDWLLEPADPEELASRQASVRELAPQIEHRERLLLLGRQLAGSVSGPDDLIAWAEGENWLERRSWLKWFARALPLLLFVLVVATFAQWIPAAVGFFSSVGLVAVSFLVSVLCVGTVHDIFNRVSSPSGEVRQYLGLFEELYAFPVTADKLVRIRADATLRDGGALKRLRELARIMSFANFRHSPLYFFLWLFLQPLALWDFHVLAWLETWQRRYATHVRSWFEALAELETLASLAAMAQDYPDWTFAEVNHGVDTLQATGLGHPLLTDEVRVTNDVSVGPQGSLLLVTGSNMSGKSTLLRSIGLNTVLAQAGGPACATHFRCRPLTVATSMRIHDSLTDGVSFYLAELRRLKQIVDQARDPSARGNRTLLYLLDEILQGTNSRERHIAVERVLAHLLAQDSIGAVSTHDLELAQSQRLSNACRSVHFRETLTEENGRRQMKFDYRMRDGVATTTNALKLLELVGLGPEAE